MDGESDFKLKIKEEVKQEESISSTEPKIKNYQVLFNCPVNILITDCDSQ